MIPAPPVDGRRVESFFEELKRYAPHYTPDLNLSDEQGVGVALMRIFAQLAEIVSVRLDQAPHKHFVAFLDRLGISLLPARPARAAVTFRLASGLQEIVNVPIGTRVTASGKDDDIPFETTGELNAIPGVLTAAFGVDPLTDRIFGPPPGFLKQESRTPSQLRYQLQSFVDAGANRLQLDDNTELEPGSFVLIGCSEKRIVQKKEEGGFITLYHPVTKAFPAETPVVPIRNFEVFDGIDRQEHVLYIGHASLLTVKEEVEIKLNITLQQNDGVVLQPLELVWQFWTKDESGVIEQDEHWHELTVKSDRTAGLSSSGEIVLVKPAKFEIKSLLVGGNESRWIRAHLKQALPVGGRPALPEVESIELSVSTGDDLSTGKPEPKSILADQGFYNATPLDLQVAPGIGFLPFGSEPRQFDQFYIASKEAFSKREATVSLDFKLDLQTLAAPSIVSTSSGLRSYSIGLRRRLYEFNLQNGNWQVFPNPLETQGSPFLPIEDSVPSAITDGGGGIFVFVNAKDSLTPNDPANKVWVHFHGASQTSGSWTDLGAPTPAQNKIKFSPAALRLPSGWHFSRVFVVGGDGKLYSRGYPNGADWDSHGSPVKPDSSLVLLDSPPFVVVSGTKVFVFVNGEGVVHWLTLDSALTAQWRSLKPNNQNFTATYRPFAQPSGVTEARVFAFAFTDPANKTTGRLFECDTSTPPDANQEVAWTDLGQPTPKEITETGPEAHAPIGYLENPTQPLGSEGRHIFLRGSDNKIYERLDGTTLSGPQWELRSRPGDPDLRDSPAIHVDQSGSITRIQVFSASGRNSLVQWIFEAMTAGVSTTNAIEFGVLLNRTLASGEDHKYNTKNLKITFADNSVNHRLIDAYDGREKLARLANTWSQEPDSTSSCEIVGGANLGSAEDDADLLLVIHNPTPLTDAFTARPTYLRINNTFASTFNFYSRATGMLSLNAVPSGTNTFVLYYELTAGSMEHQSPEDTGTVPELSWEYWNGRGWLSIRNAADSTRNLLRNGLVRFDVPEDIESTEVAGQDNFWIRARLVGGDYGRETFKVVGTPPNQTVVSEKSSLRPPKVQTLRLSYKSQPASPEACLTFNNLDYLDQTSANQTEGSHFSPFVTLEDRSLTLFFGFDKTFQTGPVRLLLDAAERDYDESKPPEFEWNFRKDRQWKPLDAEDGSVALTRQGILTLSASEELTRETRFGQFLFWIKGSLRSDRSSADESATQELASTSTDEAAELPCSCSCSCACSCSGRKVSGKDPCAETQDQITKSPGVAAATADYPLPLLSGVFPNTVWAIQGETITEEIIGSGDGEQNQIHSLQNGDVLDGEDVRVQEVLSAEERERIERELGKLSVTDREDLGGTWVRWKATKALFDSGPQDRCYEIDRAVGQLRFGDGSHGSIPPAGVDNIRAFSYRTGGGSIGNIPANGIEALATAVEGIESAFNPASAGGGSDKADTNAMLIIGPRRISHLDRAVSAEDFEELAYEASRQVAKVRCLPTTNLRRSGVGKPDPCDPGQLHEALEERGRVSVIIVPDSNEPRPCPSLELRRSVKEYLRNRAPSALAAGERIVVRPPDYVTVGIEANIFVTTLERAAAAETQARTSLEKFLHPVRGGPEGAGWDFGRPISKSDVYALLERIPDIDRIEELQFHFRGQTAPDRVVIGPNDLLASGEHRLAIKKA